MRPSEKLQRVRRLARQAEQNVEQQAAVVAALKLQGHNSDDAKNLLGAYTAELDRHRTYLDRLLEGPDVTPLLVFKGRKAHEGAQHLKSLSHNSVAGLGRSTGDAPVVQAEGR